MKNPDWHHHRSRSSCSDPDFVDRDDIAPSQSMSSKETDSLSLARSNRWCFIISWISALLVGNLVGYPRSNRVTW